MTGNSNAYTKRCLAYYVDSEFSRIYYTKNEVKFFYLFVLEGGFFWFCFCFFGFWEQS
jgi:hypothetical protein